MNDNIARGSAPLTLRARRPAYSVMQECLRIQGQAAPLSRRDRFFGRNPLSADARSWYQGALGEIEVARILDGLGPEWTVLHSVPVGARDSDIDHVVLGPTGVYTINTKHHAGKRVWVGGGTFLVDGHRQWHIRNSLHEAERASRKISHEVGGPIDVTPVIVVVGTASLTFGSKKAPSVAVLTGAHLRKWLVTRPRVHSPEALAYLGMVAEERGTWHDTALDVTDTLRHEHRFERLQREISESQRRRRRWNAGVVVVAIGAMAGGAAMVGSTLLASILTAVG